MLLDNSIFIPGEKKKIMFTFDNIRHEIKLMNIDKFYNMIIQLTEKNIRDMTNIRHMKYIASSILIIASLLSDVVIAEQDELLKNGEGFDQFLKSASSMNRLYGVIVSVNGKIYLEEYFNGSNRNKLVNIKSASKSIVSALIGIAVEQGFISDVNEPIKNYFDSMPIDNFSDEKKDITIANLLSMQSGLRPTSNRNYGAWILSKDWIGFALAQPMEASPGTVMRYSTGNTHLLSAILTRATGKNTWEFAREFLGEPLGFTLAPWPTDPQGIYFGGNDMEMTAWQMLRFGELFINSGRFKEEQIVTENWIKQSFQKHAISTRERGRYYGYGWWLKEMAGYDTSYAWGYGGQYIILVPKLDLVIVTTSNSTPHQDRRSHRRELTNLIEDYIIRVVAEVKTGSEVAAYR